jgi:hypothetical protein
MTENEYRTCASYFLNLWFHALLFHCIAIYNIEEGVLSNGTCITVSP